MKHHVVIKILWIALGFLCLCTSHSSAQASAPYTWTGGSGSTAVDFEFRLDGSIIEEGSGTEGGSGASALQNSDLEATTRFIWYPAENALRAGAGISTETISDIGQNSVALGNQTVASGWDSTAIGGYTKATLDNSFAQGWQTKASSYNAVALGVGTTASGNSSLAMNSSTMAIGANSVSMGLFTYATGWEAVTTGYGTSANANNSTATGYITTANSYASFVIGTYNLDLNENNSSSPNLTAWVNTPNAADPLFEVGDGTSSQPADAFVVYKDGNAAFQGSVSVPQSGDIPMYTGD